MSIWSRETRGFDSSVPRQLARISILRVNLVLTYGIPPVSMREAIKAIYFLCMRYPPQHVPEVWMMLRGPFERSHL